MKQIINSVALWVAIIVLFLLGLKADTRSVERDNKILQSLISVQGAVSTNQKAIIQILESPN